MIDLGWLLAIGMPILHLLGVVTAIDAVLHARSSQGAIAWAMGLVMLPYIALPLYWIFGRSRFHGYVRSRRIRELECQHIAEELSDHLPDLRAKYGARAAGAEGLERLAKMPVTDGNHAELLIDGAATFGAIFDAIDNARDYLLVQFFVVKDDELGRALKQRLVARAKAGVSVWFLYDEVGSSRLSRSYLRDCRDAGIDIRPFHTTRGPRNRFQLNFRNHRKIVVADGRVAFVGGLNVGDEYMGRDPKFGPWRDTDARFEGPSVQCVQLTFVEDWYWATGSVPALTWKPQASRRANMNVIVVPSGPADRLETCALMFVQAINNARERLWITSPYFVPDIHVTSALELAALRGVDVRIMLPDKADHLLVYLSAFSYLQETAGSKIRYFRYQPGFMHHKVMLVDDRVAAVGTANLDNRSFRLNFEITMLVGDLDFAAKVAAMLEDDFTRCREQDVSELEKRSFWFKAAVKFARLLAPIQ